MNKKTLNILLLFAVSIFSFAFHFVEVLLRGWDDLYWATYFHFSFLIAPLLFMLWLNFTWNWKLGIIKNLIFAVSYALCFVLIWWAYREGYNRWLIFLPRWYILCTLTFPILIPFFENILLSKVFKLPVCWWGFITAFFLPVTAHLIAQLVNLGLEKLITFFYYISITDMIFQFKTGSIIFAYMFVEGLFIEITRFKNDRRS